MPFQYGNTAGKHPVVVEFMQLSTSAFTEYYYKLSTERESNAPIKHQEFSSRR